MVIERVNPKHCIVGDCKTSIFETHQGDMINNRKIARKPSAGFRDDWRGQGVEHYADFYPLLAILEFQYAEHGLVECALRLDDVIMGMVHSSVDRNAGS